MLPIPQRLALAVQHHEAGRLAEAENLYRDILQEAPRHPHALHLLGVLAHQTGHPADARDLIHQALAVHGPHPVFHSNLASVYLALGQLSEAQTHARAAIELQPGLADAHGNLAVALRRQGKLDEAEAACREAICLNPRHTDARCNLGATLHQQGRYAEALAVLQETVRLDPGHAQAHNDLGGVLLALGHAEEAVRHLREAIRLRPQFAEAHGNLAMALRELDRIDEAVASCREGLRINPAYPKLHNHLGYLLEVQGQLDEALAEFQEARRLDPADTTALAGLSKLATASRYSLTKDDLRTLQELAIRTDVPPEDLCRVHFALAWTFDQTGEYEQAFAHCRRANDLRQQLNHRRGLTFDLAAHRALVERLIPFFTLAYFERVRSFGSESERPVFIVGMFRSGTSLAEQILASHPQVHGAGELHDIERLMQTVPRHLETNEGLPECLARLDPATTRALADEYLLALGQRAGPATRVIDKLPFNFLHLGFIATLFPRARVIHCRRDPRDTCLSCFFQNFADPHPFALDLAHLGRYYREYERLMAHWARVLPLPVFELQYEELTAQQEAISRRLVAFCGLEWDKRCLRFHESRRVVRTASTLQVRRPMYQSSVGRWKHYQAHLQPLLEALQGI
jgi:tetratricopeptide (TPR) repeat protein